MSEAIERYLLAEIAEAEARIAADQREVDVLKRRLVKLRLGGVTDASLPSAPKIDRLVTEHIILEKIKYLGGSGQTARIYRDLKDARPTLSYGTFRTYLHRMKQEGLLHQRERGRWWIGPERSRQGTRR